jgi:hypothetical protein
MIAPHYTPIEKIDQIEAAAVARTGLPHIHIGMNTTVRATRERPRQERDAIRWLGAYIKRERLTAEDVCDKLDADVRSIRAALTDPAADVKRLGGKIESMRAVLDANLRAPAPTAFFKAAKKAFDFAVAKGALVEFIDLTRTGKTTIADWLHLTHLHRCGYVDTPQTVSYHSFIVAIAKGLGISVSSGKKGKKTPMLEEQIDATLGANGIDILIFDEGHYLWPINLKRKPERVEYVRKLWDRMKRKLSILVLSTPQAIFNSNQALQSAQRWSPGQWEGRINRFHPPRKVDRADVELVARWHCLDGNDDVIRALAAYAESSPGFYGAMTNVLDRARFEAGEGKLTLRHVATAIEQASQATALGQQLRKGGVQ